MPMLKAYLKTSKALYKLFSSLLNSIQALYNLITVKQASIELIYVGFIILIPQLIIMDKNKLYVGPTPKGQF